MFTWRGRRASSSQRALIVLPIWIILSAWMWFWWLQPERIGYGPLYIPLTLALFYEFAILPSIFLYFVTQAKAPRRRVAPKGKKVAVISLCVPSKESVDIVERQLKSMSEIEYPHDSWILDEGGSKKVEALAKKYNVKYFSRKGIKKYNQESAPFQAKTKAGNVNAWLDHVKRRKYEYFVQFDIDHLARPDYLHKTLGHFRDSNVAWVQAPSIYGNRSNWIARGAAEQELVLQGPLQMGFFGHSETPFIIGSHCTYRTSAINEIGGFQPTRAEDHLDTVALSSRGYRGVFVPEILAVGDGPETLTTYLAQQFAWAYSMFQVLMFHTPKLLKSMHIRQKWQFIFAQTWYPLWSMAYFTLFMIPMLALLIGRDSARVEGAGMLTHFAPLFAASFLIWWAARPLMKPHNLRLSWRGMILHAVRWPIILRAVLSAVFRIKKPYMITPKGSYSKIVPTAKLYQPFVLLGIINALAIIAASLVHGDETLEAQSVFALTNALFMAIICLVDLGILLRKGQVGLNQIDIAWIKPVGCTATLLAIIAIAILYLPAVSVARAAAIDSFYHQEVDGNPQDKSPQTILELTKSIPATHTVPTLGLYSPNNNTLRQPHIEHIFIDWRDNDLLIQKQYEVLKSRNTLLVTIEPRGEEDGAKLLSDIESGAYDERLDELSTTLGASGRPVYVRFAHEMELANLYPWGNQDPDQFKRSFRYVVDYFREHQAENVKWVWSPAGNDGSELYYPGDDVVDVVGVTVLYDQYFYGQLQPSFSELVQLRSSLAVLGKPMWVVEFGVGSADPEYQAELLETAIAQYQSLGYESLIYLDIADSNIDGPDYRLRNQSALRAALAPPQREPVPAATTPSKSLLTTFCPGPAFQTMLTQNKTPRLNDC